MRRQISSVDVTHLGYLRLGTSFNWVGQTPVNGRDWFKETLDVMLLPHYSTVLIVSEHHTPHMVPHLDHSQPEPLSAI